MEFYEAGELERVLRRAAVILDVDLRPDGAVEIAGRSRGTPRIANRLLRRVRDYAEVRADGILTEAVAHAALAVYEDRRREATAAVVLANRRNPPDAILREVYERTGDRPFERLEDYVTVEELARITENYKQVAGFTLRELQKGT